MSLFAHFFDCTGKRNKTPKQIVKRMDVEKVLKRPSVGETRIPVPRCISELLAARNHNKISSKQTSAKSMWSTLLLRQFLEKLYTTSAITLKFIQIEPGCRGDNALV